MLLHQNHVICSLYMKDLLPTEHSSFSLEEDKSTQENTEAGLAGQQRPD